MNTTTKHKNILESIKGRSYGRIYGKKIWRKWKIMKEITGPPEHGGQGDRYSRQCFLSMCLFFQRVLEMPFLKEVAKNGHGN